MLMSLLQGQGSIDTSIGVGLLAFIAPYVADAQGSSSACAVAGETLVMEIAREAPDLGFLHVAQFACCGH